MRRSRASRRLTLVGVACSLPAVAAAQFWSRGLDAQRSGGGVR